MTNRKFAMIAFMSLAIAATTGVLHAAPGHVELTDVYRAQPFKAVVSGGDSAAAGYCRRTFTIPQESEVWRAIATIASRTELFVNGQQVLTRFQFDY